MVLSLFSRDVISAQPGLILVYKIPQNQLCTVFELWSHFKYLKPRVTNVKMIIIVLVITNLSYEQTV